MRRLFADAFYWIALLHAGDQWHQRVIAFTETLGDHHLYTTDAVLDEYLATYSARESYLPTGSGERTPLAGVAGGHGHPSDPRTIS